MYVSIEVMYEAQILDGSHQPFHRVIRVSDHAGAYKQSFNVITPVKLDRKIHQLGNGECSPRQIITSPVDAVGAIIHTIIRQHDL